MLPPYLPFPVPVRIGSVGGKRSFAATHRSDGVAPIPDLPVLAREWEAQPTGDLHDLASRLFGPQEADIHQRLCLFQLVRRARPQLLLQPFKIHRFSDEFEGSQFAGPAPAFLVAIGRHHHDRQIGKARFDLAKQLYTAATRSAPSAASTLRHRWRGGGHSSGKPAARIPGKYVVSHRSRTAGV
jgi:hypothetical protein